MTDVIFSELPCEDGFNIGVITLNKPKALNALTLNMIELLHEQLTLWECNQKIKFVFIEGAGDKAFCAGGDVVSLYHFIDSSKSDNSQLDDDKALNNACGEFFTKEYQLDLYLHEYKKPIIAWGDGYVFGGGLGLFAGASHRITTEKTIMAMPETAIGLYPDVGASWFLNKMPNNIGLFLGITGAFFNTADAKFIGLSHFSIDSAKKKELMQQLCESNWTNQSDVSQQLNRIIGKFESDSAKEMPISKVKEHEALICSLLSKNNIDSIYNSIINYTFEDEWLITAQNKLRYASPLSIHLTYTQLTHSKTHTLEECFNSEVNLSVRCCQFSEFAEGVRAQLVDKDKKPRWAFNTISDIEPDLIDWFFTPLVNA